jgi:hypothetical protein
VTEARDLDSESLKNKEEVKMKLSIIAALLVGMALALSGCIVEPGPGGWCYYHPYRCGR